MFKKRGTMLEDWKKLMPHNDLVAVSYYPFFVADKDRLAALDWMTAQFDEFKKPYAMVETNDAAERLPLPTAKVVIEGTPEKQEAYYRRLLALAQERDFAFVISFVHQDYDALWEQNQSLRPRAVHRLARLRPARRKGQCPASLPGVERLLRPATPEVRKITVKHLVAAICFVVANQAAAAAEPPDALPPVAANERLRVIVETDAGGDPDDEQSLVRFLLYCNEWDVEGIICNRAEARDGENRNSERTGLGIVQRLIKAYGECYPNLIQHDPRYPKPELLLQRTVPGYENSDEGVELILAAVDSDDPRPVWFLNWGTDHGAAPSCLRRALDRVHKERGPQGYATFKNRLRLSSDDQFGEHTTSLRAAVQIVGRHVSPRGGWEALVSPVLKPHGHRGRL